MIIGLMGLALASGPSVWDALGSIEASDALALPLGGHSPRMVIADGVQGMVLAPRVTDLEVALVRSHLDHRIPGVFHDYEVHTLDVETLDGVQRGSVWQVMGVDGVQRCHVSGFEYVASVDAAVRDVGAPCGQPLVIAALDCERDLGFAEVPMLAVSAQHELHVAEAVAAPVWSDVSTHPQLRPLIESSAWHSARQLLLLDDEDGRLATSFSMQSLSLNGEPVTVLTGRLDTEMTFTTLSMVLQPGQSPLVMEGRAVMVMDLNNDGRVDVLRASDAGEAGVAQQWSLAGDVMMFGDVVINWCDVGC